MVISSTGMTSGWKIRIIFSQNYGAGSVMICGRISSEGFTELVFPDGKAFSRLHQSIRRSSPTFWEIMEESLFSIKTMLRPILPS